MSSIRPIVIVICAFSYVYGLRANAEIAAKPDPPTKQHIAAVEGNLSTYYSVEGSPDTSMNLQKRMAQLQVTGVSIAVIHHGKLEWVQGYGTTKQAGPQIQMDTVFGAASISKALTAMAIMRFVQDGKLHLDDDVNRYLKSWKLPDNQFTERRKVTIRELLSHTSGIGTHNGWVFDPTKDAVPTTVQMLNGVPPAKTPAVRVEGPPGEKFQYANGGFLILQQVLIDVSGEPFWKIMQETVLGPLGMSNSTFRTPLPETLLRKAATCYNGLHAIDPAHFMLPDAAAGGLWTTAEDLSKFVIELQREYAGTSHRVLTRQTAREMLTPGLGASPKRLWGLGLEVGGEPNSRYFEHGGSGYWETEMIDYLDGEGVIILSSGGPGAASFIQEVARSVATVYHWPDFKPVPKTTVPVDPSIFDRFQGVYGFMTITREGDQLMAEIPKGGRKAPLLAASPTEYFLEDSPTTIKFNVDASGQVNSAEFVTEIVHLTLTKAHTTP